MQVLNEFKQLMERIEGRMASDAQLIKDAGKLVKKFGVQLSQLPDHSQTNETGPDVAVEEGQSAEEVNYKGVNLLKLGGINDSERAKRLPCNCSLGMSWEKTSLIHDEQLKLVQKQMKNELSFLNVLCVVSSVQSFRLLDTSTCCR